MTAAFGIATGGLIVTETSLASEPVGMGISMTEDWKTKAPIVNTCQPPWLYWDTESYAMPQTFVMVEPSPDDMVRGWPRSELYEL